VLLLHVRVLVPEDWILLELRLHETPVGDVMASVIVPVKPFCGATAIVAVPEAPLLKLSDEALAINVTSCVPVTVTVMALEWARFPLVAWMVTV